LLRDLGSEDASNIGYRPGVSSGDRPASERYKYMPAGQLRDGANVVQLVTCPTRTLPCFLESR
jgi:hypothetical protein